MKCYKINYQNIGSKEEVKVFTKLLPALKFWFKIRKSFEWSFGITQSVTIRDLEYSMKLFKFLEKATL